jgi:hypothetical protein
MLAIGIPASTAMALMLGGLLIQGIQPGPRLMTQHPDIFWGLVASMWIGNLMLLVLNLPLVGVWIRLLQLPVQVPLSADPRVLLHRHLRVPRPGVRRADRRRRLRVRIRDGEARLLARAAAARASCSGRCSRRTCGAPSSSRAAIRACSSRGRSASASSSSPSCSSSRSRCRRCAGACRESRGSLIDGPTQHDLDGISDDLARAAEVISRAGLRHVELQSVWSKPVGDLSAEQVRDVKRITQDAGLTVSCLSHKNLFGAMPVLTTEVGDATTPRTWTPCAA